MNKLPIQSNMKHFSQAPIGLNIIFVLCIVFTLFYFSLTTNAVQVTQYVALGFLTILFLIGITYSVKNTSISTIKNLLLLVLLPFSTVLAVPSIMVSIINKYSKYNKDTSKRITSIDTLNAVSVVLLLIQIVILYSLILNFYNNDTVQLIKPSLVILLGTICISLNVYNMTTVDSFLTNG